MLEKAKKIAWKYLSYRPRSTMEIKTHLKKKGFTKEIIDNTVNYLVDMSFLDDKNFCEMWIRERINLKPIGRKKIIYELLNKGIKKELINNALSEFYPEETEIMLLERLIDKKISTSSNNKEISKEKLFRYFYQKGFNRNIIINNIYKKLN